MLQMKDILFCKPKIWQTVLVIQQLQIKYCTTWKVSKYGLNSGRYFPAFGLNTERYSVDTPYLSVFSPNAGKYGPELIPYLGTFHAVLHISTMENFSGDYLLHVTKWKISLFTQHALIKMVSLVKKHYQFFFTD